jgi:aspartate-semialdehyde dehydrogenase
MTLHIAIVGATGAVGREMIRDLEESGIQDLKVRFFASARSKGTKVTFRGRTHEVEAFQVKDLADCRYILMSAGGAFSKEYSKALVIQGSTVIDNSSAWRMDETVPLIVPEVNGDLLRGERPQIIANPNCSTIQMVVALKPLADRFGLDMVQVATYQSVSGTGQKGIAELGAQLEAQMKFQEAEAKVYAQPIAFNCLPAIDVFDEAGHCGEEIKMVRETRKILGIPTLAVLSSTVRVPTFHCHGEMVNVRLAKAITRADALAAFAEAKGIVLVDKDDHKELPTPRTVAGDRRVFVSRVRLPYGQTSSNWLQFWNVADNLKKGAATNAVQILELLVKDHH